MDIKVDRTYRKDVYDAYFDHYVGFMDVNTIGWQFQYDLTTLEKGKHKFKVECKEKECILASKEIEFENV